VRSVGIDSQSFWYDEAVTEKIIHSPVSEMVRGEARDNGNPPGYWIAARCWQRVVGEGDARLRGLSVLFGVLTIPFVGMLGRRLISPEVGLVAALAYAVSPLAVEFANEARAYAQLQLLSVVNAWLFARWLTNGGLGNWLGYAQTMFLCWYTHYYAAFLPLTHLFVLTALPWTARRWAGWAAAIGLAAAAWATWLPTFVEQLTTPGNIARSAENWKVQFLATPVSYAFGRTLAWRDSPSWVLAAAGLGTLVAFLVPAAIGVVRIARHRATGVFLVGWLLLPVLLPLAVAVTLKPVYSHRYAAIGLPAFAVIVAAGYVALRPGPRCILATLALGLSVVSLYRYATEPLKDDWRSATPTIVARSEPGTLLVFDCAIEVVTFQHYAGPDRPAEAIGLDTTPADGHLLPGVRYRDGRRLDRVARDYAPEIFSQERVCLVLCVPKRPQADYVGMFQAKGYAISATDTFHRIEILWLTRTHLPHRAGTQ
jgi:mannosyltransferase